MVDLLLRCERQLTRLALAVAVVMLVVSVSFSFYQVLTRFVFNAPSTWSEVAARTAMIWCVFMAAAATFRGGYMMAVEAIYKVVPGRLVRGLEVAIVLCSLLVLAILFHFGLLMTQRVASQTMSGMNVSMAYAYAAIPVGAAFAMVAVLARLLAQLSGREPVGPDLGEHAAEVEMHDPRRTMPESAEAPGQGRPHP
ncbi:TRAP transporter small permease [Billgrantia lactosivorans]|uniref:TRAP transporter small permease n=1 Tax=Billgrantia lactosivorans TaxID=2185141 RepID=UPI000DAB632A|nr:TRAP transporter small permease [Halomonas lactosivorans]